MPQNMPEPPCITGRCQSFIGSQQHPAQKLTRTQIHPDCSFGRCCRLPCRGHLLAPSPAFCSSPGLPNPTAVASQTQVILEGRVQHNVTEYVRISSEHYGIEEDRHLVPGAHCCFAWGSPSSPEYSTSWPMPEEAKTSYCPHSLGRGSLLAVKTALPAAPQHLPAASALALGSLLLSGLP